MKKFLGTIITLMLSGASLFAQTNSNIIATVVDTDNITWANGSWSLAFVPNPQNPNIAQYRINNTPLDPAVLNQKGTLTAGGAMAFTTYANTEITPSGSSWVLNTCPQASAPCGTYPFSTAFGTQNISAQLHSSIPAPRFTATSGTYGYADVEAQAQNTPGATYYDVTQSCQKYYSVPTTSWGCSLSSNSVVNININSQINVKAPPYNAKGDGALPGDTAAFKAACTDARLVNPPKTLYIPWGRYLVDDLAPECMSVSMIGQQNGMAGAFSNPPGIYSSSLIGKPGKDILHQLDPHLYSGAAGNLSWSLEDLTLVVDDSIDPNNRAVQNGISSTGGTVISSTMAFTGADVGKLITLYYHGGVPASNVGDTDVATITAFNSASSVTVSPAPSFSSSDVFLTIAQPSGSQGFPHRWPGRWQQDASMALGSSIVTSVRSQFTCGDVGQWIVVKGAGAPDLVTKIPTQAGCTTAIPGGFTGVLNSLDLGAGNTATTAVSAAYVYTSVNNYSPFTTIGNCAIAGDNYNGNPATQTMTGSKTQNYAVMKNITINTVSGVSKNSSCAIMWQGVWVPNGLLAQHINIMRTEYGLAEIGTDTNTNTGAAGQDFQQWSHMFINVTSPFIIYNGGGFIDHTQLSGSNGFTFLAEQSVNEFQSSWRIDISEFELNSNSATHLHGSNMDLTGTAMGRNAFIDGVGNHCTACGVANNITVSGYQNDFRINGGLDTVVVATIGSMNIVTGNQLAGTIGSPREMMLSNSRVEKVLDRKADFLRFNPLTPFNNLDDLWIWPQDFICGSGVVPNIVADATSTTGYYSKIAAGCTEAVWLTLRGGPSSLGGIPVIGGTRPVFGAGKYQLVSNIKCPVITSFPLSVLVKRISDNATVNTFSLGSQTCSTNYTTLKNTFDLTSYGGGVNYVVSSYGAGEIDLAWEGWRPYLEDINGTDASNLATLNSPAFTGTPTTPTAACGATTQIANGTYVTNCAGSTLPVPANLAYLGDGSEGALNQTSGSLNLAQGEHWYSSINISSGATVFAGNGNNSFVLKSTGACTIAGTLAYTANINAASGNTSPNLANYGGGGGGGGGGTAAGTVGAHTQANGGGGAAGTAGGGTGGNGITPTAVVQRMAVSGNPPYTMNNTSGYNICGGGGGGAGGTTGGAGGKGGGCIVLVCNSLTLTGTIDVSGQVGVGSAANNSGSGGGGGGGYVLVRSPNIITNTGTINVNGAAGGTCGAFTGCGGGGTGASGWSMIFNK